MRVFPLLFPSLVVLSGLAACTASKVEDSGVVAREFSDCDPLSYE